MSRHDEVPNPLNGAEVSEPDAFTAEPDAFTTALARAFTPVDPPAGFADRVLARAAQSVAQTAAQTATQTAVRPRVLPMRFAPQPRWRVLYAMAATVLIGCMLAGFGAEWRYQQQVRSDRQFDTAVAVTSRALDHTRAQLARAGIDLDQ